VTARTITPAAMWAVREGEKEPLSSAIAIRSNLSPAEVDNLAGQILPKFSKDCNKEQALEVARIALAYELDPFLGELIPYQGRPYITIDGRIRLADRHPGYDGYDIDPATETERKALGATQDEIVWKCTVHRRDRSRPTTAYGRAGGNAEANPVAKRWTAEVAMKRAVHRALRAAFPVPIPGLEDELTDAQMRAIHAVDRDMGVSRDERHATLVETFGVESSAGLTKDQAGVYLDGRAVDAETGEIIDVTPEPLSVAEQFAEDVRSVIAYANNALTLTHVRQAHKRADNLGLLSVEEVTAALDAAKARFVEHGEPEPAMAGQPALVK